MLRILITLVLVAGLQAAPAHALPITFLVTAPADTPADVTIHLAGNFQDWQPGATDWALSRTPAGQYSLTAEFPAGQGLQFKFTQGSWLTVEKGPQGEELSNRLHVVSAPDTLRLHVANWADGRPEHRADTITGQVETITVPDFLDGRRVWVYLPPGYDVHPEQHYPVLYMFDGQNVFNDATSFVGEWQVDETLERLISAKRVAPLIVVAVDNGSDRRLKEYTPWSASKHWGAGGGRDHLQHWVEVLLPAINTRYRTRTGPAQTGLAGSSLGGLMSLYGGFAHPEIFGKVGAFSPSTHVPEKRLFKFCRKQPQAPQLVYVDMGTREAGNLVDDNENGTDDHIDALRQLQTILTGRDFIIGWDLLVVEGEGAQHNEQAWAHRFPAAVEFLFPPQ